ncbi:hypothetical protein [Vreelandella boliviensis]|uniref:hypothetical protein n=1 Tax=Vreelandella boliviensis TaxID=223527 RepID=UPI001B8D93AF|nr:hypothetical protein [Halomonas boliviensis]MBS3666745.1 hypothetical protein [Halomonas boliviensis]
MKTLSSRRQRLLRAVGSLIDIQPSTNYRDLIDAHKTDLERLSSDWDRIGKDMDRAVERYDQTFIKPTTRRRVAEV